MDLNDGNWHLLAQTVEAEGAVVIYIDGERRG